MSPSHPSCRAIEPDLVALAGGEATPTAAQAVEEHTAHCPSCRDALRQYRAVEGLVADLRRAPLPEGIRRSRGPTSNPAWSICAAA